MRHRGILVIGDDAKLLERNRAGSDLEKYRLRSGLSRGRVEGAGERESGSPKR